MVCSRRLICSQRYVFIPKDSYKLDSQKSHISNLGSCGLEYRLVQVPNKLRNTGSDRQSYSDHSDWFSCRLTSFLSSYVFYSPLIYFVTRSGELGFPCLLRSLVRYIGIHNLRFLEIMLGRTSTHARFFFSTSSCTWSFRWWMVSKPQSLQRWYGHTAAILEIPFVFHNRAALCGCQRSRSGEFLDRFGFGRSWDLLHESQSRRTSRYRVR